MLPGAVRGPPIAARHRSGTPPRRRGSAATGLALPPGPIAAGQIAARHRSGTPPRRRGSAATGVTRPPGPITAGQITARHRLEPLGTACDPRHRSRPGVDRGPHFDAGAVRQLAWRCLQDRSRPDRSRPGIDWNPSEPPATRGTDRGQASIGGPTSTPGQCGNRPDAASRTLPAHAAAGAATPRRNTPQFAGVLRSGRSRDLKRLAVGAAMATRKAATGPQHSAKGVQVGQRGPGRTGLSRRCGSL
jgi:hypothetical protein